ncbi:hypothetical protein NDU88_003880 [Pleurodeles waltl]|uniref:Uncharacterized protein n=1 Tax=Pleurodeles waltl TaxID=8319 RepID=A0AAV7KZS7_PLEWA|nr:hypothetical protein NDU88_003880 [Pleurodeles waltl]
MPLQARALRRVKWTSLPAGGEAVRSPGAGGWLAARGRAPTPAGEVTGLRSTGREVLRGRVRHRGWWLPPRILGPRYNWDGPGVPPEA